MDLSMHQREDEDETYDFCASNVAEFALLVRLFNALGVPYAPMGHTITIRPAVANPLPRFKTLDDMYAHVARMFSAKP